MRALRRAVDDYVEMRRGPGFKLNHEARQLRRFASFMGDKKATRITTKLALQFATMNQRLGDRTMANRLCTVRAFARHLSGVDAATEIPPFGLLRCRWGLIRPYIYSQDEIIAVLEAARNYPSSPPLLRETYAALFGLLAVTGMRVSEALNLRPADVDWAQGVLTIHNTKFGKSRLVPLHASTLSALTAFVKHRDQFFAGLDRPPPVSHFFSTRRGTRFHSTHINQVFRRISSRTGLRPHNASRGPRLHDLRHRFAIETLLRWYRDARNVDNLMPSLSTYLGHTHVSGTYWYLRCTPELMAAASNRLERRWEGVQ